MTRHEAFMAGMIWGGLTRAGSLPFEVVDCAAAPDGGPACLVVRWKSGTEVLITVTETRTAPTPEP